MSQTQIQCNFRVHVLIFFFIVVLFTLVNSYSNLKCPKANETVTNSSTVFQNVHVTYNSCITELL